MPKPWEKYQQEQAPWERYQAPIPQETIPEDPTFLSRMGADLSRRGERAGEILEAQGLSLLGKEQTLPETLFQLGGEGADVLGDLAANLAASGYEHLVPELTKQGLGTIASGVGRLPTIAGGTIGEAVPEELSRLGGLYESPEESTRFSRNIEALGSLATMLTPLKPAAAPVAFKTVGKAAKGKVAKLIPDVKKLTADDLAKESGKAYQRANQLGGTVKSDRVFNFLDESAKLVDDEGISAAVKKVTARQDKPFMDVMDDMYNLVGEDVSLNDFQKLDEFLGSSIDSFVNPIGKIDKTGRKLLQVQENLRDMVTGATSKDIIGGKEGFDALSEGRKLWSRQAKLRDIEKIVTRAELSQQPSSAIKSGLRTLVSNPKKMRGYSKGEVEALKRAAKTGAKEELLSMVGSRLPSIVAAGAGSPLAGGALRLGAIPARELATKGQLGKLEDLSQLIARGAPPEQLPLYLRAPRVLGTAGGGALEATGGALGALDKLRARQALGLGLTNKINGD